MTDTIDKSTRSRNMRRIGAKDTMIELLIRSRLYQRRFGFRKNIRIPIEYEGKIIRPEADIFLSRYKAVVLVHGCYWHHHGCRLSKKPLNEMKSFWQKKLGDNIQRDLRNIAAFNSIGLRVVCLWECSLRDKSDKEIDDTVIQLVQWIKSGRENTSIP